MFLSPSTLLHSTYALSVPFPAALRPLLSPSHYSLSPPLLLSFAVAAQAPDLIVPAMMKPAGLIVGSSPAREKLPAPPGLARFLRGSRSRGRSSGAARSSPIFVSRSRSAGRSSAAAGGGAVMGEAGDPSSPKVTCIGQVRIRNKSKRPVSPSPSSKLKRTPSRKASRRAPPSLMPCRCLQEDWICSIFPARKKPKGGTGGGARRSIWRRWAWLSVRSGGGGGSRSSSYRQQKAEMDRPPFPELFIITGRDSDRDRDDYEERVVEEQEEQGSEHEKETRVFVPPAAAEAATPPKNALLLMRCRSAPQNRASALATVRFAVSSLPELDLTTTEQKKGVNAEDRLEKNEEKEAEDEKKRELSNATSDEGRETLEPTAVAATAADGEDDEDEEEEDDEAMRSESQRPLVLTRSKSEPARSAAEKLAVAPAPAQDAVSSYCFWNSGGSGRRQQRQMGLDHEEDRPTDTAQS